jgi:tRNA threonylcarbamoyladenosine biosynthesis protein TsaB
VILAVETATGACSVALSNGSETYTRYSEQARAHSELAMGMVDAVLAESRCNVLDIEGLGVTIGPGSFTGLRIGFSIVQGLAFALDLPVAPVSTLKTLVATYQRSRADARKSVYLAALDARMGQFAVGVYRWNGEQLTTEKRDCLLTASAVYALINQLEPTALIGETEKLLAAQENDIAANSMEVSEVYPHALDLYELAAEQHRLGLSVPIEEIELCYLRGTEAWTKRTRISRDG